ncbi:EF-hand domain pair [Carpediemonas membranifera]|uniref:EF-hand domain pair n=1 Tax=Carpediemonas membranifera TaxID=201153 RepID=A0A8J6B244_9EUKA|nr:EF-hand domain pair [Carpediemonas membranifera]|eukprot:KAG9396795.1 EF-hand domain pair [Carpediemonas membranifera]
MDTPTNSLDKVRESQEIFDFFDSERNGTIVVKDIERVFNLLGVPLAAKEALNILTELDADDSGEIDFVEFATIMANVDTIDASTVIDECFNLLRPENGTVSLESLFTVLKSLGFTTEYDDILLFVAQMADVSLTRTKGHIAVDRKQFEALVRLAFSHIGLG